MSAPENGGMYMSSKDWRKVQAAERFLDGEWSMSEAAMAVGLSARQMRRLCRRVEEGGAEGVVHGNRGRAPVNRIEDAVRQAVIELRRTKYAGFNDTHFTEKLREVEGTPISRGTVRTMLRGAGIGSPRKRRPKRLFRRRERKPKEGLMLLWDGSNHDWLEGRGTKLCLMGAVDDATGKLLPGAHFVEQECSAAYLRVLFEIIRKHGVPWSMYMDRHSCLKRNDDHWTMEEELKGKQESTQVGRALEELDIEPIFALSAQAKGRIERVWGTLQDRLVSELRLANATTLAEANAVLTKFRQDYNRRFARRAAEQERAWRPKPSLDELRRICAFSLPKPVHPDNTVHYEGHVIDLPAAPNNSSYRGQTVDLRHLLNGEVRVYTANRVLAKVRLAVPKRAPARRRRTHKATKRKSGRKKMTFKEIAASYS